MKKIIVFIVFYILTIVPSWAQCAMCKATVKNNASDGGEIVAGLNAGILYLALMPYLIFIGIVYFWYKQSKKNYAGKNKMAGYSRG